MSRSRVAFYGSGHLGRQVHHHLSCYHADAVDMLGFVDDTRPAGQEVIAGLRTLGGLDEVMQRAETAPGAMQIVFAIGYSDMQARRRALDRVRAAGYRLLAVVHPRAVVEPGAVIGEGCVLLAGVVVDQQVRVGPACYLDVGVRLTAGTEVGANNYFSTGVSTGSRVRIGDNCFIGMDCTITTEVQLGSNLFVNAKSLVSRNLGDNIKLVEVHKSRELPLPAP